MANHSVRIFLMRGTASFAARAAAIAVTTKPAASQKTSCVTERKTVWTALMNLTAVGIVPSVLHVILIFTHLITFNKFYWFCLQGTPQRWWSVRVLLCCVVMGRCASLTPCSVMARETVLMDMMKHFALTDVQTQVLRVYFLNWQNMAILKHV